MDMSLKNTYRDPQSEGSKLILEFLHWSKKSIQEAFKNLSRGAKCVVTGQQNSLLDRELRKKWASGYFVRDHASAAVSIPEMALLIHRSFLTFLKSNNEEDRRTWSRERDSFFAE